MADDLTNRGPADRERLSLTEEWEVRYWCKSLGVNEAQLQQAVAKIGHMTKDVRAFLKG
jgi:hypothetical protein